MTKEKIKIDQSLIKKKRVSLKSAPSFRIIHIDYLTIIFSVATPKSVVILTK